MIMSLGAALTQTIAAGLQATALFKQPIQSLLQIFDRLQTLRNPTLLCCGQTAVFSRYLFYDLPPALITFCVHKNLM